MLRLVILAAALLLLTFAKQVPATGGLPTTDEYMEVYARGASGHGLEGVNG